MAVNNIQFTKIEIQIASYLFKHYKEKYNARQLARILKINHAHANKLCNILVSKHLLRKENVGSSIYFSFNYGNRLALKFMCYLLSLEQTIFPKWLAVALHNLKNFKDHIILGVIFGSSIKNNTFNDVDVLLVYDNKNAEKIKKIKEQIRKSQLIEQPIRYVDITEKDIYLNKDNKIFYNILSGNLIFHNAEKYVEVISKCHK
ncbi:MAG: hypothetical protein AABX82_08910 [Nanoarchaeota archaeon]